ncbi:hypothetical protein G432_05215 [Sphingomonas sp. MM-1]|uniref:hypothetical protein n=1 Tax=Sphingomonas sp. MM-1 TaxID=745310 RepID=UPI0002C11087|nr:MULTISPECIES: hypothetical protein [unclassified Sphingomonas]AGH48770.1 hypothetical protein G432_05215 [Sphingomonas sp. MM-1]MDX3884026.1 hypothetical protein [Sphingomonas sp.]
MELLIFLWLAMGVIAAIIAGNKNRNALGYGCLGFLLGPIGILIAAVVPRYQSYLETDEGRLASKQAKRCPDCAEIVQYQAKVCKHCSHRFA